MFIYGLVIVALIWLAMIVLRRASPEFLTLWSVRLLMVLFISAAFVFLLRGYIFPALTFLLLTELTRRLASKAGDKRDALSLLQVSTFRAPFIILYFSHKTQAIEGYLIEANNQKVDLNDVDEQTLTSFYHDFLKRDLHSSYLLEAYLNSRFPTWRENLDVHIHTGTGINLEPSAMSQEEAYEIMGLTFEARDADLARPYRLLMKKFHPDKGGSLWFASRINQARDIVIDAILTRHNSNSQHNATHNN